MDMTKDERRCPTCRVPKPDKGRAFDGRRAYRCVSCGTKWTEGSQGRGKKYSPQREGYQFADSWGPGHQYSGPRDRTVCSDPVERGQCERRLMAEYNCYQCFRSTKGIPYKECVDVDRCVVDWLGLYKKVSKAKKKEKKFVRLNSKE